MNYLGIIKNVMRFYTNDILNCMCNRTRIRRHFGNVRFRHKKCIASIYTYITIGPLLLIWINLNSNEDNYLRQLTWYLGYKYLSNRKIQRRSRWSLDMNKLFQFTLQWACALSFWLLSQCFSSKMFVFGKYIYLCLWKSQLIRWS